MRPGPARVHAPTNRRRIDVLVCFAVVALLATSSAGCASFIENFRPIVYGKSAKENYEKGIRSMKGESHLDAA